MITGLITGDRVVVEKLKGAGPQVMAKLLTFVKREAIKLQGHVKADKLTGQVLHVRTGTLRRSITERVEQSAIGVMGVVGTNVVYAKVHEFGFAGTQSIREHLRTITQAWGKELKGGSRQVLVNAYTRHVDYPERSFLRSALRDLEPEIRSGMEEAMRGTFRGLL